MHVSSEHKARHSEQEFSRELLLLADAGAGVIHVRTNEVMRAVSAIRRTVLSDGGEYVEWDVVNGSRIFTPSNVADEGTLGDENPDIISAFSAPLGLIRDAVNHTPPPGVTRYYIYVNPQVFMESNPPMHQLMLMYNEFLPTCQGCVILVTPDMPLPEASGSSNVLSIRFAPPSLVELRERLSSTLDSFSESFERGISVSQDQAEEACHTGAGMSVLEFETYVSLAAVRAAREGKTALKAPDVIKSVQTGKVNIVNSSDILELFPSEDIREVGGMNNLKDWVRRRAACYSDEAREFGVEPPKGMVLVGVPGSGKSLVAKAIAGEFSIPLVRLDFSRVFSSYVGSSEHRIRTALAHIESMSPVVLLADEIDKGLGGIANGSGADSGVSMRVLGAFLTWLQECRQPVFTIMTANNIDGLPPELMRRGRFDAIFSTTLPTPNERREVLEIHLRKRGKDINDFEESEINAILSASDRYVPAEIESAVKDALVLAFSNEEPLMAHHITQSLESMVPLSKAFASQIDRMTKWAEQNATPVSLPEQKRISRSRGRRTMMKG